MPVSTVDVTAENSSRCLNFYFILFGLFFYSIETKEKYYLLNIKTILSLLIDLFFSSIDSLSRSQ